jgi:hypothetical protein
MLVVTKNIFKSTDYDTLPSIRDILAAVHSLPNNTLHCSLDDTETPGRRSFDARTTSLFTLDSF